jgi:hypothetical protein
MKNEMGPEQIRPVYEAMSDCVPVLKTIVNYSNANMIAETLYKGIMEEGARLPGPSAKAKLFFGLLYDYGATEEQIEEICEILLLDIDDYCEAMSYYIEASVS